MSVATASRVLNDLPIVSTDTRARVREAIDELGYRRNSSARSLSLGRTHTVGVVAPLFTTPSVVERLRGVAGRLAHASYDLLLFGVDAVEQRTDALQDFARRDRIDGVLVISLPVSDEEVEALSRTDFPVVLVDAVHPDLPHVVIGHRVPEDVAVIGFDDIDLSAIVGLTTVRQPLLETGARGADLLLHAIEGGDRRPVQELKPLTVVERRTT